MNEHVFEPRLGSLIRLRALPLREVGIHADLEALQDPELPQDAVSFASSALDEAERFITAYVPQHFTVKAAAKKSPPSAATVELLTHDLPTSRVPKDDQFPGFAPMEYWFARRSVHENVAKAGTASWEEFNAGLRVDHSKNEMDYTPNVYEAHEVLNWEQKLAEIGHKFGKWEEVHMNVMEMVHQIPSPLQDRVFPVVLITAKKQQEFIVIQMPIVLDNVVNAKFTKGNKRTTGMYVSVERCEMINGGKHVQWQMATASDAKGNLPMWMQKMGVPGAVVKDVGFFIKWCEKHRASKVE